MGNYTYNQNSDPWTWRRAIHTDVEDILNLVDQNYSEEILGIFTPSRTRMGYHLHKTILEMSYNLNNHNISIARDRETNQLLAWSWIERGKYQVYANEEMAVAEFAHVDLALSARNRVKLLAQIIELWITWAETLKIPVLVSTTIRNEQTAFMRLHEQYGFVIRGSFAYRKNI